MIGAVAFVLLVATRDERPALARAAHTTAADTDETGPRAAAAAATSSAATPAAAARVASAAARRTIRAETNRRAALRLAREQRARIDEHVFPIRGRHDRGRYETNDFGGGRGHQGQDMFADCGTPLVAALGGVVKRAGTEGAGGNYVVIAGKDRRDYVYMHLAEPPPVRDGQKVASGQRIGHVGDSGNADGCHLHFEVWTAPGWYTGGEPIDTAKLLAAWDAAT